jgi:hypothetical protein
LYQRLCGMQKWTGRHVRCDMDQWLCMRDHVAFMHFAFIRPQPYITHQSTPVVRQRVAQNGCMVLEIKAEGLHSTFFSYVFVLFHNLVLSLLQ